MLRSPIRLEERGLLRELCVRTGHTVADDMLAGFTLYNITKFLTKAKKITPFGAISSLIFCSAICRMDYEVLPLRFS